MKKNGKVVVTMLCAAMLVCASVMGTLAYLTDTDNKVTNTFTVGSGVVITLDEADVTPLGELEYKEDGETPKDRVAANSYKLIPGHSYVKDPTIHVDDDSEDCYLFVEVLNGISDIEASTNTVASQLTAKGWLAVDGVSNVYVYVGTTADATAPLAVTAGADVVVFDSITIDGQQDATTLAGYTDDEIVVNAYAVQKDGLTDKTTGKTLWDAAGFTATSVVEEPEVSE